jgi:hypothetical protein
LTGEEPAASLVRELTAAVFEYVPNHTNQSKWNGDEGKPPSNGKRGKS